MKEIKLTSKEWKLLLDLKTQLEQAQTEASRRESTFIGVIYGICAAKDISADRYDLSQMKISDGTLTLVLKAAPNQPQPVDDRMANREIKH